MKKLIIALATIGLSAVAFANDPATTGTPATGTGTEAAAPAHGTMPGHKATAKAKKIKKAKKGAAATDATGTTGGEAGAAGETAPTTETK